MTTLLIIGCILAYGVIAFVTAAIAEVKHDVDDSFASFMMGVMWPVVLVLIAIYWVLIVPIGNAYTAFCEWLEREPAVKPAKKIAVPKMRVVK